MSTAAAFSPAEVAAEVVGGRGTSMATLGREDGGGRISP